MVTPHQTLSLSHARFLFLSLSLCLFLPLSFEVAEEHRQRRHLSQGGERGSREDTRRGRERERWVSLWGAWLQAVWCPKRGTLRFALFTASSRLKLCMSDTYFSTLLSTKTGNYLFLPPFFVLVLWNVLECWGRDWEITCTHTLYWMKKTVVCSSSGDRHIVSYNLLCNRNINVRICIENHTRHTL